MRFVKDGLLMIAVELVRFNNEKGRLTNRKHYSNPQ